MRTAFADKISNQRSPRTAKALRDDAGYEELADIGGASALETARRWAMAASLVCATC